MGATKVDNLHNSMFAHDHIIKLKISVGQTHAVQICNSAQDLQEAAADLLAGHLACHLGENHDTLFIGVLAIGVGSTGPQLLFDGQEILLE